MKGKAVWKRLLAMVLTAAMVLTGMNLTALDASAEPSIGLEQGNEKIGLSTCPVWEDGQWIYETDGDGAVNWQDNNEMWLPGRELAFKFYDGNLNQTIHKPADLRVTYYRDDQLQEVNGMCDPRIAWCIKQGQTGTVDTTSLLAIRNTNFWRLHTDKPGWYVISLADITEYDERWENAATEGNERYITIGTGDNAETLYESDMAVALHVVLPRVGFFDSTEISAQSLINNWSDEQLNFKDQDAENRSYYLYFENDYQSYVPGDADDEWAAFEFWSDGTQLKGDLKNGIPGVLTATQVSSGSQEYSLYKIEFDENMKYDHFSIRARFQRKDDHGDTPEAGLHFAVTPKPYSTLYVQWPDWDEYGHVLFLDNGAPACYQWDGEEEDFVYDDDGNRIVEPKELWKWLGMDFTGGDIWLGYYDAAKDSYTALVDQDKLTVDYYQDTDAYFDGAKPDKTNIETVYPSRSKNVAYFYPMYGRGVYEITYKDDPDAKVVVDAGYPGMELYTKKEATQENLVDRDHIKLITDHSENYYLGIYEMGWDETLDKDVYLDISGIEIRSWDKNGDERYAGYLFDSENCDFVAANGSTNQLNAADYIGLQRSGQNLNTAPHWYQLALKTPSTIEHYEVKFYIRKANGDTNECYINVDIKNEGDINVYSDIDGNPNDGFWDGYNFRAINPIPLRLRFTKMKLEGGKAVEEPFTAEQLKSFKLYSRFKLLKNNDGDYVFRWLGVPEVPKSDFATMQVTDDGWIELMLMQQSKEWVLRSDDLEYEYHFENSQPSIGFFTSDQRPDIMYGMEEPLKEWTGDEETVYEIAGKKTTKPAAKYLWVWSDPTNGYSALPGETKLSVLGKKNTKEYVLSTGKTQMGKNLYDLDRINYSGYSVDLSDQIGEDYTLVVDIDKYGNNYRWFGNTQILNESLAEWDEQDYSGDLEEWMDFFEKQGFSDVYDGNLEDVMAQIDVYTPSADGSAMNKVTNRTGQNNLYVLWNQLKIDELHEQYYYDVHVERFAGIKVATPGKTAYTEGEAFSTAGMKVMAYYADEKIAPVDVTAFVKAPAAALKTSDQKVTLTYEGFGGTFSADLAVTVSAKAGVVPAKKGETIEAAAGSAGAGGKYKVAEAGSAGKMGTVILESVNDTVTGAFTIPATIKGTDGVEYQVVEIAAGAFKNNAKLTAVTIGDNVTSIGAEAFSGAKSLTSVTAGKNVAKIGKKAFAKCAKLKTVKFKGTALKEIGDGAFSDTKALKSMDLSKQKIQKIGKDVFSGSGIKTLKLYVNAMKSIGKNVLKNVGGKKKVKVVVFAKDKKVSNKWIKKLKKGKAKSKLKFSFKKKK